MTQTTAVPTVNMDQLFKQYGEATLQLKIATGKVQQIEIQLQQILNQQSIQTAN